LPSRPAAWSTAEVPSLAQTTTPLLPSSSSALSPTFKFEDELECFFVDLIDEMIEKVLPAILSSDPLGTYLFYDHLR